MKTSSILSWGAAISGIAYVICLALPALDIRDVADQVNTVRGIDLAATGGAAVLGGNFAWLANCALFLAWLLAFADKPIPCFRASLIAFFLSLHTFRFNYNHIPDKSTSCCLLIEEFHFGSYLWLTSIFVMLIMAWAAKVEMRLTSKSAPPRQT